MSRLGVVVLLVAATLGPIGAARADTVIPAGSTTGRLTVLAANVRVDGTVTGPVTVIHGDLLVTRHGTLGGGATVVGGALHAERGAQLRGDVDQLGASLPLPEGAAAVAFLGALIGARMLLAWLLVVAATLLAERGTTRSLREELAVYPLQTVAVGLVGGLGACAIAVLLAVTIVGLVAALAVCGLVLLAAVVGVTMVLEAAAGDRRVRRLLEVVLVLPVLGELSAALAIVVGLGAGLRRVFGRSAPARRPTPLLRAPGAPGDGGPTGAAAAP